ncbi:MAG: PINc/VapC family ATPase [Halobacteriales archaeon]
MKIVPDTSVVVDGRITERIESGEFKGARVIVPESVVAELESQANKGRETGHSGIEELKNLSDLAENGHIVLEYVGPRPTLEQVKMAKGGEIDSVIRDVAVEHDATFVTSDGVQAEIARAKGLEVIYLKPEQPDYTELEIEQYFDEKTMSVHLKQDVEPKAKRGEIGAMRFRKIRDRPLQYYEVRRMAREIVEAANRTHEAFIEVERDGMTIVQIHSMRIAIARPPFSDGIEITAVRPIADVGIEDYRLSDDLKQRLLEKQRGMMIAGAPGAGKTTFAQAIAEFLNEHEYAVKTMESPRDLQVLDEVTQYTTLEGDMENTADVLLMVRPDYTIYDEVRKSGDFEVFADMRLAGVGMVGVVHANRAIDSVQRLVGRVELGMIPQVVDTVVHIEDGAIERVYELESVVKVPEGLVEEDLARPVIKVSNFETDETEFEIYSFNRQVVVMPVGGERKREGSAWDLVRKEIQSEIGKVARGYVDVKLTGDDSATIYLDEDDIPFVIGKGGATINEIEDKLGISIDVKSHEESPGDVGGTAPATEPREDAGDSVDVEITSNHVVIELEDMSGETVEVKADGDYLFTATVGRQGDIKVSRGSEIAEKLEDAVDRGRRVTIEPV